MRFRRSPNVAGDLSSTFPNAIRYRGVVEDSPVGLVVLEAKGLEGTAQSLPVTAPIPLGLRMYGYTELGKD